MASSREPKSKKVDSSSESSTHTEMDMDIQARLTEYFAGSPGTDAEKLASFAKYVLRQNLAGFLSRFEIFRKSLAVQGSVVECGVYTGGSLMIWAQLSAILEPVNILRKVIGFDTFTGFPEVHEKDRPGLSEFLKPGGLAAESYDDLLKCVELYDTNRFLSHIPN